MTCTSVSCDLPSQASLSCDMQLEQGSMSCDMPSQASVSCDMPSQASVSCDMQQMRIHQHVIYSLTYALALYMGYISTLHGYNT